MKTRQETIDFLESLQWERMTKRQLQSKLQSFFDTENKLEDSTDADYKNVDYSFIFTSQGESCASNLIDVEVYYLKMRNGKLLITGTELLDYIP